MRGTLFDVFRKKFSKSFSVFCVLLPRRGTFLVTLRKKPGLSLFALFPAQLTTATRAENKNKKFPKCVIIVRYRFVGSFDWMIAQHWSQPFYIHGLARITFFRIHDLNINFQSIKPQTVKLSKNTLTSADRKWIQWHSKSRNWLNTTVRSSVKTYLFFNNDTMTKFTLPFR